MLKHAPWIRVGRDILVEYEQCILEGREVEQYKKAVQALADLPETEMFAAEDAITELCAKMANSPIRADYPYVEPSTLPEILAESPSAVNAPVLPAAPEGDELLEKLSGAWIGRIAGCLLGKPVEGWRTNLLHPVLKATDNYPMHKYIMAKEFSDELVKEYNLYRDGCFADNVHGAAPIDDDTNYTTFALKLVSRYGRDFKPDDVLEAWLAWIPMLACCTAERVAYRNAAMGLWAPETATHKNPYREWIGAQIRGDFFGYINPGNPAAAAEMAFRDASISHVKNGIYGEMYIAAMIAAAAVTTDIRAIIDAGLAYVPAKSRLTEDVKKIIALYDDGKTAEEIMEAIHAQYNEHSANDWCYTNSNAMIVTMALLCGGGDFGKSICLAVQPGFDTDCNGATVGSIVGIMNGEKSIDPYWYAPFEKRLHTSISGYNLVEVDDLAKKTAALVK